MRKNIKLERGQALILIVFAIVGLIGMTGLTVDGGMVYSDRRHAQNAADTAVLAGARALIRGETWKLAALSLANTNGYSDTNTTIISDAEMNNVEVYLCNETRGQTPEVSDLCGFSDDKHILVVINSTVNTMFGRVVGITQMTNTVRAVAEVEPGYFDEAFEGNAVVGLAPHECSAVEVQGNADVTVTGGGIYVNSDCDEAFNNDSGSANLDAPSLCTVGDYDIHPSGGVNFSTKEKGCDPKGFPPDNMTMPDPVCTGNASISNEGVMEPGNWSGDFPPNPPGGGNNITLQPGIYCINDSGDFALNAGYTLSGSSALLRINNGDIRLNGGATVNLSGINQPSSDLHGLLIFMPLPANPASDCPNHDVRINGSSTSTLTGTILVPCADVRFNGGGDVPAINGQVLGYTVDLSGTGVVNINYDDAKNWNTLIPPSMELTK